MQQFYATKKRKAVSPVSKRIEKGARLVVLDGSPSAKGSLETYLVPSQGDESVRPDSVRRNLASEIGSYVDKQPVESIQGVRDSPNTRIRIENEMLLVDDPVQVNNLSDFGQGGEKSELKQFKADFLSLYCRYLTLIEFNS